MSQYSYQQSKQPQQALRSGAIADEVQSSPYEPGMIHRSLDNTVMRSCEACAVEPMIQKQEGESEQAYDISADAAAAQTPMTTSAHTDACLSNPQFPNFQCLIYALKLDVDENLWNNAPQFFRVASLFPDDDQLMFDTFMRYGLGINLLQTSFGFLGADETLGTILSYGTGIGLKSYDFFQNGILQLDVPIPITDSSQLDLSLDLNADPDNLTQINGASAGVGFSGHF